MATGGGGGGSICCANYCNKNCDQAAECSGGGVKASDCKAPAKCGTYTGPVGGTCSNLQAIFDCYVKCVDTSSCQTLGTCVTGCPPCK